MGHAIAHGRHIECPERVCAVMRRLDAEGLRRRCQWVHCRDATLEELGEVHAEELLTELLSLGNCGSQEEMDEVAAGFESIYLTPASFDCASSAAGGVLDVVQQVVEGQLTNGLAIVRPPGHHAEAGQCCGFCVFNNVAVAAAVARRRLGVQRVLIVDWDVHHGNGTQHAFEADPSVLYFSVHRYDNGEFFPGSRDANPRVVGRGPGAGFNVNVAWNLAWKDEVGPGDDEYLAAWQCVLLPIATEFRPELILVSAGFDAAAGDLGGCSVSPAGFAQLTRMLQQLCPQVVLVLEGGYELAVISECACACARALLGDQLPVWRCEARPTHEARLSLERTLRAHRQYWPSLGADPGAAAGTASHAPVTVQGSGVSDGAGDGPPPSMRRRRKRQERDVTGVSVATRNAANGNYKADVKRLSRQEGELRGKLDKIGTLRRTVQGGSKVSRKDNALLEQEDEVRWQLEEVAAELKELTSLSKGDVLRMYTGCS